MPKRDLRAIFWDFHRMKNVSGYGLYEYISDEKILEEKLQKKWHVDISFSVSVVNRRHKLYRLNQQSAYYYDKQVFHIFFLFLEGIWASLIFQPVSL